MMSSNNADYSFSDITINTPVLPVTFAFKLQGQNNEEESKKNPNTPGKQYCTTLEGLDLDIAKAALTDEN